MPTVPVVDQTAMNVQPVAAPSVTPMRNDAPQQLEQSGQAVQQAGALAMKTGQTIGDTLAAQVDEATVKQAEATALGKAQSINYDPQTGFLNQKGQNAIDGYQPAVQAVNQEFQDQAAGLSNSIQKQMFHQATQQHLLSIGQQMAQHNYEQTSQFSGEAAVNRANMYAQMASNASSSYGQTDGDGSPTGDFATNLATAEEETLKAVQITKGAPADSDVANQALLNLHTQVGVGAISQMLDARAPFSKVQSVYDDLKAKGMLTIQAQDTLGKMVKSYTDQESTHEAVNQSLSDAVRASQGQPTSSTGTPDYQAPIKGATVTSQPYDPEHGVVVVNAPNASNIQAPADGKVMQVGKDDNGTFGMQIQHADGSVTTFSGLGASNVAVGDQVQRGEEVGTSGAPAVLWSLADKNGNAVDPTKAGLAPVDLTKVTDEKVLGAALDDMRKQVTDPYLQQQATSEMESIVRHNQSMANAQATQTYKAASDAFYKGGMNWRSIPPSTFGQLTGEQQQSFKDEQTAEVLKNYNQSQEFKGMSAASIEYAFAADPESLTPDAVNRANAQGLLPAATATRLMGDATARTNNPQAVQDATGLADRIKYFAAPAGVNVNPKTDADKQTMTNLTYSVNNAVDQIKSQNKGKATAQQVDDAIKQQLIQHTTFTPRSPWNPLAFTGISPAASSQQYQFQSGPKVGDTRSFPNGKTGKWDGQGWVAQ